MVAARTLALALLAGGLAASCATFEIDGAELGTPTPPPETSGTPTPAATPPPESRPVSFVHDCESGVLDIWQTAAGSAPELHLVGLYTGMTPPLGTASMRVKLDRPGRMILVVSAYDATRWTIEPGPSTQLLQVIHNGYEDQTVLAPMGVPVVDRSGLERIVGSAYEWTDPDTAILVAAVENFTGLPLYSFGGCYTAANVTLGTAAGLSLSP